MCVAWICGWVEGVSAGSSCGASGRVPAAERFVSAMTRGGVCVSVAGWWGYDPVIFWGELLFHLFVALGMCLQVCDVVEGSR